MSQFIVIQGSIHIRRNYEDVWNTYRGDYNKFASFFFYLAYDVIIKIKLTETEAGAWKCSVKKVFFRISLNSQKTICGKVYY